MELRNCTARFQIGLAVVIALISLQAPRARGKALEPNEVIQTAVDQVLEVLRDQTLRSPNKRKERIVKIRDIADKVFDWELMAMRSLGPTWRDLSDEKRSRFVTVFKETLADQYADDMDHFQGTETVTVDGLEKSAEKAIVRTTLITHGRERVPIHYFMHRSNADWRVHDFSVEGVSLVNHYRKSFRRFLVNKPFDALLGRLERKYLARP